MTSVGWPCLLFSLLPWSSENTWRCVSETPLFDHADFAVRIDHEALYSTFRRNLLGIELNRLFAQLISSQTAPLRFDGALSVGVTEFLTNLATCLRILFTLQPRAVIIAGRLATNSLRWQISPRLSVTWCREPHNSVLCMHLVQHTDDGQRGFGQPAEPLARAGHVHTDGIPVTATFSVCVAFDSTVDHHECHLR